VLTRWTAHLLAYERLSTNQHILNTLVSRDLAQPEAKRSIIIGDSKAKQKAEKMTRVIRDPNLWSALKSVTKHLRPLGIA
ncbi:hypothetical protein BJ165DRAFT_1311296, partial [Panaeolus papilionaceus]